MPNLINMNETKVECADEVENAGRTSVTGPDHGVRISAKTIIVVLVSHLSSNSKAHQIH